MKHSKKDLVGDYGMKEYTSEFYEPYSEPIRNLVLSRGRDERYSNRGNSVRTESLDSF